MRIGSRAPGSRAVSHGSSASTVPTPTSTASCVSRRRCTSARARLAGDPLRLAFDRRDLAVERDRRLERERRPAVHRPRQERLDSRRRTRRAARRATAMPARRSARCRRRGPPSDPRCRSRRARRPTSRTTGTHGGVRPWWLHGSRLTYSVAPRRLVVELRERGDLAVRRARAAVRALGDHLAARVDDHAADDRIRRGAARGSARRARGARHESRSGSRCAGVAHSPTTPLGARPARARRSAPSRLDARRSRVAPGVLAAQRVELLREARRGRGSRDRSTRTARTRPDRARAASAARARRSSRAAISATPSSPISRSTSSASAAT